MFPMPPDYGQSVPAMSASACRERARRLFAEAVAEPDPQTREALLQSGDHWMLRWRYWPPV
jgi:hypothetical protein